MSTRRLAVVTGASSGIGAACTRLLAADGWRVVMVARRADALAEVAERIAADGGDAVVEALDGSDGDAVAAMAQRVMGEHGVPEAVVNSAGAGEWRFIEETPPALGEQMMAAPYTAAYNTTHAFMAPMLARRSGVFVHVGSPASICPWPGATAYTATRWALRGLHEALRQDLRGTGLHSCHVVFSEVASSYFEANDLDRSELIAMSRYVPVLSPEDCAQVILDTIRRPRPEVLHPWQLRALVWLYRTNPPLGRQVAAWGGRRHR